MICHTCYREIAPGGLFCPHCGARVAAAAAAAPPQSDAPAPLAGGVAARNNPWEERARGGLLAAFAETLQRTLFQPAAFFRATAPDRGVGASLGYAVLVGTLSSAIALLWQRALADRFAIEGGGQFPQFPGSWPALVFLALLIPPAVAIFCVASAAVQHLTLAVLGGARGTFGTTLKAVCYSCSALAFNVFPVCGMLVASVWQVVVQVIGVRELHRTSTARAFLAWLLPVVIATCLAGAVFAAAMLGMLKVLLRFGGGQFEA